MASARSGSMMPAIPTKVRSCVNAIGSLVIVGISCSSMNRAAKASTRRPFSPIRAFAASMSAWTCSTGVCAPVSEPPDWLHRASTTSGAPLTSSMTRSTPPTW